MPKNLKHIDVSALKDKYQNKYFGANSGRPTYGLAVPFSNNNQGCLCLDGKSYNKNCCGGYLRNQGIGSGYGYGEGGDFNSDYNLDFDGGIQTIDTSGAFSNGFSNGFDIFT
jgi:hypothetical protein